MSSFNTTHKHDQLVQYSSKVFGCKAFVHIHDHNRSKLEPRALLYIFLGYSATQKGYRCYSPEKRRYFVTMDVTFFENQPFYPKKPLQGEIRNEAVFWNPTPSPILPLLADPILSPSNKPTIPVAPPAPAGQTLEPTPGTNDLESAMNINNSSKEGDSQQQPKLRIYSQRNTSQRIEKVVDPQSYQESESNSSPKVSHLDCPIALRK